MKSGFIARRMMKVMSTRRELGEYLAASNPTRAEAGSTIHFLHKEHRDSDAVLTDDIKHDRVHTIEKAVTRAMLDALQHAIKVNRAANALEGAATATCELAFWIRKMLIERNKMLFAFGDCSASTFFVLDEFKIADVIAIHVPALDEQLADAITDIGKRRPSKSPSRARLRIIDASKVSACARCAIERS